MRLLNTKTGRFKFFDNPLTVRYAILSHVWAKDNGSPREQSYQELLAIQLEDDAAQGEAILSRYWRKIRKACAFANANGYDYIWIDSCCIDKTSSAELAESINSMFNWYRWARVCYAYLDDVTYPARKLSAGEIYAQFCQSQWFFRGWTLQELIAPDIVLFLSSSWTLIDSKHNLADVISQITKIDAAILRHTRRLRDACAAERMSWAHDRLTSKKEDEAYSLLGIFGIHINPMYGEGTHAFIRLQEAILAQTGDYSIYAWGTRCTLRLDGTQILEPPTTATATQESAYLLASSPSDFAQSRDITHVHPSDLAKFLGPRLAGPKSFPVSPEYIATPYGIRLQFPLITSEALAEYVLAVLACKEGKENFIALILRPSHSSEIGRLVGGPSRPSGSSQYVRLARISKRDLNACLKAEDPPRAVYVHHRVPRTQQSLSRNRHTIDVLSTYHSSGQHDRLIITVDQWCRTLLRRRGYRISPDVDSSHDAQPPASFPPPDRRLWPRFHLESLEETITITICLCTKSQDCKNKGYLQARVYHVPQLGSLSRSRMRPLVPLGKDQSKHRYRAHVCHWNGSNGSLTATFELPSQISLEKRYLMLTLSLKDSKDASTDSARNPGYALTVEVFKARQTPQGEQLQLEGDPPRSTTRIYEGRGTSAPDLLDLQLDRPRHSAGNFAENHITPRDGHETRGGRRSKKPWVQIYDYVVKAIRTGHR